MARNTNESKKFFGGIATGTLVFLLILGTLLVVLPVRALLNSDETVLRWWAGLATLTAIVGMPAAFLLGRLGARERIAGMDFAIDKLTRAASGMIDLRGQSASTLGRASRSSEPPDFPSMDSVTIRHKAPSHEDREKQGRMIEL